MDHHKLDVHDFVSYLNSHDYDITTFEMETGFKEKSNITIYYKTFRIDLVGLHRDSQRTQLKNAITMNIYTKELKIYSTEFCLNIEFCILIPRFYFFLSALNKLSIVNINKIKIYSY